MSDLEEFECDCPKCVSMCKGFPCRPLPEEVRAMPNDVAARLMIKSEDVEYSFPYLQAAGQGYEGAEAPDFQPSFLGLSGMGNPQTCTFLSEDGKCELHGKCKPWEGRVTLCGTGGAGGFEVNGELEREWNSVGGQAVLREWRAAHYKEPVRNES